MPTAKTSAKAACQGKTQKNEDCKRSATSDSDFCITHTPADEPSTAASSEAESPPSEHSATSDCGESTTVMEQSDTDLLDTLRSLIDGLKTENAQLRAQVAELQQQGKRVTVTDPAPSRSRRSAR